jgi:hypothetical protein
MSRRLQESQSSGSGKSRGLDRREAAAFVGLSPTAFDKARRENRYPPPTLPGGRYDHHHVEKAIPTNSSPHNADNPHTAERFLGKKHSTGGDARHDFGVSTPRPAPTSHSSRKPSCREDIGVPSERHRLTGPASIPSGAWPRRMCAAYAAAYCGELTVDAFLKQVGSTYPLPRVKDGRRQLWLRDDLDRAILPIELVPITDVAGEL